MKLVVQKSIIFKALSHVQSIVEKKNTLPILSNILIEAKDNNIVLSSTDMDISITETINCSAIKFGCGIKLILSVYDESLVPVIASIL